MVNRDTTLLGGQRKEDLNQCEQGERTTSVPSQMEKSGKNAPRRQSHQRATIGKDRRAGALSSLFQLHGTLNSSMWNLNQEHRNSKCKYKKNVQWTERLWLTPIIPAPREAVIRRIMV
jgi:hypothetical protein